MRLQEFKNKLLQDPDFRAEYEKLDAAFEMAKILIDARLFMNLTQEKLAAAVKTKQSSIARIESGNYLPSLSFLKKIAAAYKTKLTLPKFDFMNTQAFVSYIQESGVSNGHKKAIHSPSLSQLDFSNSIVRLKNSRK